MASQEIQHPPLAEGTINEVWELVERAEKEFMPVAPRPVTQGRVEGESVFYGLAPTISPIEGFIGTAKGSQRILRIDTVDNLNQLLKYGLDAKEGDRTVIHTRQFPGRRIYNFLARTGTGFVIQCYENLNGQDHAEYPIVLHEGELRTIAPFFTRIDTGKPNLASITNFAGVQLNFEPPMKASENP